MNKPIPFQTLQQVVPLKEKHSRDEANNRLSERQVKRYLAKYREMEKTTKSFAKFQGNQRTSPRIRKRRPKDPLMTSRLRSIARTGRTLGH